VVVRQLVGAEYREKWKTPPGGGVLAPRVGLEPTTYRLTAGRSTIELSGTAITLSRGIVYHGYTTAANNVQSPVENLLPA
jgi:hypothetical protein